MTDCYKVYTIVLKTLKQMIKLHHPGHVVTLAMMIVGIVLSKKAQLSEMSDEVPVQAKDKSIEMRMRGWVKQENLDEAWIYLPFCPADLVRLGTFTPGGDGCQLGWTQLHGDGGRCCLQETSPTLGVAGLSR
jgi:hypothetical protein